MLACMGRLLPALAVVMATTLHAQHSIPLLDGQTVILRGSLAMESGGRLQFVTVKTADMYTPLVQGRAMEPTQEIALSGYQSYRLLYSHRGQSVTVTGKVMTDDASPYYFHNISLTASSIRLQSGAELLAATARTAPPIAVDVGEYQTSVLLPADPTAPWQYTAHGIPDDEHQFLGCSSNGAGDVVNCSCAQGFHPSAAAATSGSTHLHAEVMNDITQTEVGEERRAVTITVTCSR